jgi:hypothetical protein
VEVWFVHVLVRSRSFSFVLVCSRSFSFALVRSRSFLFVLVRSHLFSFVLVLPSAHHTTIPSFNHLIHCPSLEQGLLPNSPNFKL